MLSKTQSCEKSVRSKQSDQNGNQDLNKTDKKSQSYLAQKFQQLYSQDKKLRDKRQEKIQQNVRVKQQKQIVGCTFKPEINNNPEYYTTKEPFLQREQNWKRNIEKKITEKREQMSKKQVDGITFMPKITQSPLGSKMKSKKMMKTGYSTKANFVEKKSYRAIHNQRKKFQQIVKNTIVEPFQHRKIASNTEINDQTNNQQLNPESNRQEQVKELQTSINAQTKMQQNQQQQDAEKNEDEEKNKHEVPVEETEEKEMNEEQREKNEQHEDVQEKQKEKDIQDVLEQQEEMDGQHKQININHQYQHSNEFDKLNEVEPQNDSIEQVQTAHQ